MAPAQSFTSSLYLIACLAPIFVLVIWHLNTAIAPPPPPPVALQHKAIVLLIAHPDDESMFFSPTLLALSNPALGNHIKILCLSSGDADGLGETRKKELERAAVTLGLRAKEDVFVIDDPTLFRDGMKEQWDETEIANVLAKAFASDALSMNEVKGKKLKKASASSRDGPQSSIDVLITFDQHGVSSHPNHIALYHGAKTFLKNLMRNHSGYACPVTLYVLPTINILRKYIFVVDILPTYFHGIGQAIAAGASGQRTGLKTRGISKGTKGDRVVFISGIGSYMKARHAMVQGHKSQMVWFRWGWISIGRYMVLNDLRREYVV